MVKKPKTEKKPRAKRADVVVADKPKMIAAKKLFALLGSARKAYAEQRSISGDLGSEIKEAAEHDHLHKKAFAIFKSLDRMEPEKLADFFAHFDYYCSATENKVKSLRDRAGSVIRMDLSGDEATGETGNAKERTSNVRPFPQQEAAE